jgi:hypothetical protein
MSAVISSIYRAYCYARLAGDATALARLIGVFHDFVDFEWLLAERTQDIPTAPVLASKNCAPAVGLVRFSSAGTKIPARRARTQRPPSHRTGVR